MLMAEQEKEIGHDFLTGPLLGAKGRKVEVEMLEETYQEAMRLAAEEKWSEDEALLTIFANGLAYLKGERSLARVKEDEASQTAALQEMTERCMQMESMYSVMKFRAYHLAEDRLILELNVAGLRPENEGMRQRIFQYKEEVDNLKAEIARLKREKGQLLLRLGEGTNDASLQCQESLWGRLLGLLGHADKRSR